MAANIFGLGRKSRPEDDLDNLLGMRKSQGMTDRSFSDAGRAPVDEFFAGRNSAMIDDKDWDKLIKKAQRELKGARRGQNRDSGGGLGGTLGRALVGYATTGSIPVNLQKNRHLDHSEASSDDMAIRDEVYDKTGMFVYPGQGISHDPKSVSFMEEFDDSRASLAEGWRAGESMPTTLGGLLQHEELYKHYPELADMPLEVDNSPGVYGSYGGVSEDNPIGTMRVNLNQPEDEMVKTLLHESQHYIQDLEGWPSGGSDGHHTMQNFASWYPGISESINKKYDSLPPSMQAEMAEDVEGMTYGNISGEILARDVEARFDKRNELNAAKDTLLNPDNPKYYPNRTEENKNNLLGNLDKQAAEVDRTYPYSARDDWSYLPHDMPMYEEAMPLLMSAAMGQRKGDKYADKSRKYADRLLDEIMNGGR